MKLEYSILWFEDDHDSVEDTIDAIRIHLVEQGFDLRCDWGNCDAEAMQQKVSELSRYNPYDLMVFDYDLGSDITGEQLAGTLRSKIWTEILYYSAYRDFDALAGGMIQNKVEGVFCAARNNLENKLWSIIESQIMRVCDLNNMRGIVLDSMSEIDSAIRKYFGKLYEQANAERKNIVLSKLKRKFKDRAEETAAFQEALSVESVPVKIFDHRVVDFQVVRQRLAKKHECFQDSAPLKRLQDLRNKLAHQPSKFNKDKNLIELMDQLSNEADSFDYARFKTIRSQLLAVRNVLRELGVEGV